MQAVKFVVKLYDIPNEEGTITAFDSFGPNLFIGTDKGTIVKFLMEDGAAGPQQPSLGDANGEAGPQSSAFRPRGPSVAADASSIFTTHVGSLVIAENPKKRIARVQHSRSHYLLFALCAKRLVVVDSQNMVQLAVMCEGIGSFHVSTSTLIVKPPQQFSTTAPSAKGADAAALSSSASPPTVENASIGTASSPTGDAKKTIVHTVTAAEKHGRSVSVYELEHTPSEPGSVVVLSVVSRVVQELVLPEPVQSIVEYRGMLCLGLRREYSMLSLKDGDARSILALNNRAPLIALGDGEVFLRLQQNVFAVSMKTMPTAGNSVRRTIHLEYEPECIIFRHPFLFAFSQSCCDVFSLYDNEVVERLPLPGVVYGSKFGSGDTIYAASGNKLWMLRIHSLRSQLAGLIHRYQVSDAFHLLSYQKRSSTHYAMIERDLNVMAAYAHLYHGNATEAMHHFAGLVDVRELLRHLPELCPRAIQQLLHAEGQVEDGVSEDEQLRRDGVVDSLLEGMRNWLSTRDDGRSQRSNVSMWLTVEEEEEYIRGWCAASPHNKIGIRGGETVVATAAASPNGSTSSPSTVRRRQSTKNVVGNSIDDIWKYVFLDLPAPAETSGSKASLPGDGSAAPVNRRMIPEMGGMITEDGFVGHCKHELKRELGCYLTSTLSTSPPDQQRASEYALLVLCLQSRNYSGAYRLVAHGTALCVKDCYWLLHDAKEYRLLVTLLRARGLQEEAWALFQQFVAPIIANSADEGASSESTGWLTNTTSLGWATIMLQHDTGKRSSHSPRHGTPVESQTTAEELPPARWMHQWNSSLDEIFVALDHMDNTHLEVLLRERPDRVFSVDSNGNTLMMTAFYYLSKVTGGSSHASDMILTTIAFLVDAGCPLSKVNTSGDNIITLSSKLFSSSYGLFVLSFVTSQCTIRAQARKYMQDDAFAEFLLLAGCDPTVLKNFGTWQGYVVNKAQLQIPQS